MPEILRGDKKMQYVLWTFVSLLAYIAGLILLVRVTPRLLKRSFDEIPFMGIAALAILGGLLTFGAVAITVGVFSANLLIKVIDFLLLVGVLVVAARLALRCFRPASTAGTFTASRFMAGGYCTFLSLASLYYMVALFATH